MKRNLILIGVTAIAVTALSFSLFKSDTSKTMAFIDYNKVYNDCSLKKELEKDLEKVVSSRKSELDSMQLELSFMSNAIQTGNSDGEKLEAFENLKHRYLTLQNLYEEENLRLKEQYFTQIRTHINEKAKEFGEDNEYNYLLAAVGDGSLMYASDSEDVTDKFMEYIDK